MEVFLLLAVACVASAAANYENSNVSTERIESRLRMVKEKKYKPEWDDLDTRPLPKWYDQAKIGIFLHWGVYSVPSFSSEWFWYTWRSNEASVKNFMTKNYRPGFTYQDFAPMFTAEFFDPKEWAELFGKSGARYVVLTSKHHEGFTLFPSNRSFGWNSVDVGPHRDLVGDLAAAVRSKGLTFGVYHSLKEWYNPMFIEDERNSFNTTTFRDHKLWPDLKQLVNSYKPSIIWSDGDGEAHDTYWNSTGFLAWLYNESPVKDYVVVNDRWGYGTNGKHGDFYNFRDKYNPGTRFMYASLLNIGRHLIKHKWESAFTVDKYSWGYRRNIKLNEVLSMEELLTNIVRTVSCGGNALINVGPTREGTIIPIFQERLLSLGKWLEINGEAIYNTSPWLHQNDTINANVWYTCKRVECKFLSPASELPTTISALYAMFLKWPEKDVLVVKDLASIVQEGSHRIEILGDKNNLDYHVNNGEVHIKLPPPNTVLSKKVWTLKVVAK